MKAPKWWSVLSNAGEPVRASSEEEQQPPADGPASEVAPDPANAEPGAKSDALRDLIVLSLFLHCAGTVEEMMGILAERAPQVAGASVVFPLLVDRPREVLHAHALAGSDEPGLNRLWSAFETDLTDVELPLSPPSTRRAVLDGGEVMLFDGLNELVEDVLGREACDIAKQRLGLKKVALVPMVMEGEPLGLLVFLFDRPDPDLEVLELLAGHCAVGLKTLTALDEVARFGEIDQVTWVYDRRYLQRALEEELKRSERYERSLSLVLLDIDGFSRFNRDYGSTLGDRLLRSVAMLLAETVSAPELVARAGADEFAVLLPETDRARAVTVVSRMLDRVSQVNVFGGSGVPDPVSVSVAIACYPEDGASSDELLQVVAAGLEEAKRDKAAVGREAAERKGGPSSPRGGALGGGRNVA